MLTIVTPPETSALTTTARAKTELAVTGSSEDARIADLIAEASDLIANYCGRATFGLQSLRQTERLRCAVSYLTLNEDVAAEITAVTEAGAALAETEYELDGAMLYRLSGADRTFWSGLVVIEYDAGYDLATARPAALERACLDIVVALYRQSGRDASVRRDSVEGVGSIDYFDRPSGMPLTEDRLRALDRYRRIVP